MKLDGKIISAHVIDEDYIIATITYPMRFPVSDEHDMRTVEIGIPPPFTRFSETRNCRSATFWICQRRS